jgi:hypothetical protein
MMLMLMSETENGHLFVWKMVEEDDSTTVDDLSHVYHQMAMMLIVVHTLLLIGLPMMHKVYDHPVVENGVSIRQSSPINGHGHGHGT